VPLDVPPDAGNDEVDLAEIKWHNEKRAIRDLIPYEANPRQITDKQAKDLKASLAKFGIADPIIINTDNMIIGGHQRKKILETLLGYDPDYQIDVRVPDRELSIDEARELNVRLNKNVADWDFDILANNFELDDLLDWGFDKKELDIDLWAGEPPEDVEPQIDKAEELREKWGVKLGDLWQLGSHRLICGDCTDKAVVDRVMGGEKADMIFTDPPYGVDYEYADTKDDPAKHEQFMENVWSVLPECPLMMITTGHKHINWFFRKNPVGFLVWFDKTKQSPSNIAHLCKSELVLIFGKVYQRFAWDTMEIQQPRGDGLRELHSCPKPLELWEKILEPQTDAVIVYDPFSGSGTTLIACERLGRKCRAVEISPAYVAVAIQRWVDVTGGTPELVEPVIQR